MCCYLLLDDDVGCALGAGVLVGSEVNCCGTLCQVHFTDCTKSETLYRLELSYIHYTQCSCN